MVAKAQRQQRILELLARNRIESQEQLQDLLFAEGVSSTQATLSRDLRELGVIKGGKGYELPSGGGALGRLVGELGPSLRSVDVGGNVIVLRAIDDARARELAQRLEQAGLHQIAGALASGATVLVVARSPAYARDLARRIREGGQQRRTR